MTVALCSQRSAHPCPATEQVRRYTNGWFCPVHMPGSPVRTAHLAGRAVRVLVTGSRTWDEPRRVWRVLDAFLQSWPCSVVVVHGACARGADQYAAVWAREHHADGVTEEPHPADWEALGRRAGIARNTAMVDRGADVCVAFIRDGSPGATHCANAARAAGIPTHRYSATTTRQEGRNSVSAHQTTAVELARRGVPVLPLAAGKVPFGNCPDCTDLACGGRPNMKSPGPCSCPRMCHAWAAATTDTAVIGSPPWARAWRQAVAVAYHPGGAGITVVDLDDPVAVEWARATLPTTKVVATTRGEHWIYHGAMPSANHVRAGVDIKSHMAYARWLGPGTGRMTPLPASVQALVEREEQEATRPAGGVASSSSPPRPEWARDTATGCRHTDTYVRTGLERGLATVREHTETGAGSSAYSVARFLAKQHTRCPGPCGLDSLGEQITAAAVSVGVPEPYARRAVRNGLTAA